MALVKFTTRQPRLGFSTLAGLPGMPGFDDMENRMRNLVEGTFGNGDLFPQAIGLLPPTEISEMDAELLVTCELPGMDRKDIDINVEDGVLTIRGEKAAEKKDEKNEKKFYLVERSYGSFERSFTLPRTVDAAKISAEFDKGVLKIHLPKTAEGKIKGRKIEVALTK